MTSPLGILLVFLGVVALAVALWWPGIGLLVRRSARATRERILIEDALKHIYDGEYRGYTVALPSVAGALGEPVSRIVPLVDRMQTAGLVSVRDGRLILTDEGTRYALQVIRAHRLWERYLADETGVHPTEWHARAEQREHTLSEDDVEALAGKLGHPRFDPHGDPIPTVDGAIEEIPVRTLAQLSVGEQAQVVHVEDEPEVVYAQLVAMGIHVGMVIRVGGKTAERILIESDGRAMAVAPLLAANVSIRKLDPVEAVEREARGLLLTDLEIGEEAVVDRISPACRGIERRRIMDLGVVPGTQIALERRAFSGGLSAYRIRGTLVALRDEQAEMISVFPKDTQTAGETMPDEVHQ